MEDVRVVPVLPTKNYTVEQRVRRIVPIGGRWLEYNDLHSKIVLIYKDETHLALLLECTTSAGDLIYEEADPQLIPRVYHQLINLFFDCLASKAIVCGSRTLVLGSGYDRFHRLSFSSKSRKADARLSVSFDCTCEGCVGEREDISFACDPTDLSAFVFCLAEYVNEHGNRPLFQK